MSHIAYDIVVFGATGFTGKLVCEYLIKTYGVTNDLFRWAIAGRSQQKLDNVKEELGAPELPTLLADVNDRESLDNLVSQTQTVLTTVGPYQLVGTPLLEATVRAGGKNYVDLTGEGLWVWDNLKQWEAVAVDNRSRIVHCSGFDCIPADLGVYTFVRHLRSQGLFTDEEDEELTVRYVMDKVKGGISGGTIASGFAIMERVAWDKEAAARMEDPTLLSHPVSKSQEKPLPLTGLRYDPVFKTWLAPFIMASIDVPVVLRSAKLLTDAHRNNDNSGRASEGKEEGGEEEGFVHGLSYGSHFFYTEGVQTSSLVAAFLMTCVMGVSTLLFRYVPLFRRLLKLFVPSQGQGPSEKVRDEGFFKIKFSSSSSTTPALDGHKWSVNYMHGDPGYKGTAMMLSESAIALTLKTAREQQEGYPEPSASTYGFLTPSSALGDELVERLQARGMEFKAIEN